MPHIVDISYDNAQQYLIDESFKRPVLIDFWADWCAPCKALMPVLEKIANEYGGTFLLAKLNADQLGDISAQFGVRSLPTVILMKEGQPVDAFQGAQPEQEVRSFLDKHLPKPWEKAIANAREFIAAGDFQGALPILREAYADSDKAAATALLLAEVCLELNFLDEAEAALGGIKMVDQDADYKQLMARLELKRESAKSPAIQELEARLNEDPDNLELAYELAVQFSQDNHHREALELLYMILCADCNFREGGARKIFLDILATLGKGNPLAIEFQRKFYRLLY